MPKRGDFFPWRVAYVYAESGIKGSLTLSSVHDVLRNGGDLLHRGAEIEIFQVDKDTRKKTSYAKVTPDELPAIDPEADFQPSNYDRLLTHLKAVKGAKASVDTTSPRSEMPTMVPAGSLRKGDTVYPEFDGHRGLLPGVVEAKTKVDTTYQGVAYVIVLEDERTLLYFAGQNVYCSRKR